jgi:hypothetical protein
MPELLESPTAYDYNSQEEVEGPPVLLGVSRGRVDEMNCEINVCVGLPLIYVFVYLLFLLIVFIE